MSFGDQKLIVVAGANGNLGSKIVVHLLERRVRVRGLVRRNSDATTISSLRNSLLEVRHVDFDDANELTQACEGASCVVSALSGLREVLIDAQTNLLHAAEAARARKFIPSDYCIEYANLIPGANRNLDLRREFSSILAKSKVPVTSILNGMFTDLLLKEAPVILFEKQRIFFWGDADQKMDFTTIDNTAEYTACAALDNESPRWLRIAGTVASMRDIRHVASEVDGKAYKFLRPGGLGLFGVMIKITKVFSPGRHETFPAWQGMQYLYDMLSGIPKFKHLDNDRYEGIRWVSLKDVISKR